jgi:hypothetical protein
MGLAAGMGTARTILETFSERPEADELMRQRRKK